MRLLISIDRFLNNIPPYVIQKSVMQKKCENENLEENFKNSIERFQCRRKI